MHDQGRWSINRAETAKSEVDWMFGKGKEVHMYRLSHVLVFVAAMALLSVGSAQGAPKHRWVIALSNAYYGNIWRHQMVDAFKAVADKAKAAGRIGDYLIANGDGSANQQVAQMNSFILRKVDAILINAASLTSLNGVVQQACARGILVLAFDSIVSAPCAYKLDWDLKGPKMYAAQYIVGTLLGGKGNVLIVRGVKGSAPEQVIYDSQVEALKKYSGAKVVGVVYGQASTSVAQSAVSNILPSLPKVDAVLDQGGGDDWGIVQAFQQYGSKMPIIESGASSNFLKWWWEQYQKTHYQTISDNTAPSIGAAAFWLALDILEGAKAPKTLYMPLSFITEKDLKNYINLPPGYIVSPEYTEDWVKENLLKVKR